jgi:hypothetical protein
MPETPRLPSRIIGSFALALTVAVGFTLLAPSRAAALSGGSHGAHAAPAHSSKNTDSMNARRRASRRASRTRRAASHRRRARSHRLRARSHRGRAHRRGYAQARRRSPLAEEARFVSASAPQPLHARGEEFAGAPSGVSLSFPRPVGLNVAARCVAVSVDGEREGFGGAERGPTPHQLRLYLLPGGAMPAAVQCSERGDPVPVAPAAPSPGGVLSDPIDPRYLTEQPFGESSLTDEPWRAYMDTWPASRLTGSLGINFNVTPAEAEDTAQLLQESGFTLARIEIGWNSVSYEHPESLASEASIDEKLQALQKHGLRPLILLNANSGEPGPTKAVTLETTEEAPAGATTVMLTAASAAHVVPGKTGFDYLAFGGNPDLLIASISGDVATLAMPLPKPLPAGAHRGATLLYAPFGPPETAAGEPNPAFQETLTGWLRYLATICRKAESIFGADGYDLEVWNELSFGSQFLHDENYYSPAREVGQGSVESALLDETVAYVRNPANGIGAGVGVSDGFASQSPYVSGATVPPGTTALSKHLYAEGFELQWGARENSSERAVAPVRGRRRHARAARKTPVRGRRRHARAGDTTPARGARLRARPAADERSRRVRARAAASAASPQAARIALPEYFLTGLAQDSIVRDLAPIATSIDGVPHGRFVAPEGGSPPQVWMTEYNLQHTGMVAEREGHPGESAGQLTPAQQEHLQAEIALRSLVAMINKGMSREYFYAVTGEGWNLVSEAFIAAVNANPNSYPGSQAGGETIEGFRRLMAQMQGPGPEGAARQLSLLSIAQEGDHAQPTGDGTAGDPNLYDREALAVLPFQSSPTRFVIPVYVMSENLTTIVKPLEGEESIYRFDLPSENFRITLGNLPESRMPPAVTAYDPIRGERIPARLVSRQGSKAIFEIAATDYPRLLELEY